MDYRRLGDSGLKVSRICLGAMMFGDQTAEPIAARIVASAVDAGVNFIDTADSYAKGGSERMVGKLIAERRDRWVLATKVQNAMIPGDPNSGGLGRKWLLHEIDASLSRLGTDYIDVWYLHRDDLDTPVEETARALGDIIRAGKVRYFGLSNFDGWRIAEIVNTCRRLAVPQPIVLQPVYNAMNRLGEVEMFPACQYYGLGIVPYSPLARGVLTGKYVPGAKPASGTRAGRNDRRMMESEFREESIALAPRIKAHAEKRGMTAGQFAFNWVLNNKLVTAVIAGPRTEEQWRDYLGALDHTFDPEDEALIDGLVPPGHTSTPGYTDPKFPILGRVPRSGL
ncbi:MAG TPA: aldo/keto reductase [Burkholderiales bacterium]|nr:aldo/keto reductase [Burkholderiales bacterium]